ncbi:MAG: DUF2953 domain-containing protein, partial [Lachnospiraceae bacterium]|nr:DUF2953 domain-containing protein [Lachnospiraceae bacterium]
YDVCETAKEAWAELRALLRHYRVRRGTGYFRFGTGDPALTGELAGLLYLILPTSCGELSIEPQFTDSMLETEMELYGHIRLLHLVKAALWAFRNKKLRRLVRALQSDPFSQ